MREPCGRRHFAIIFPSEIRSQHPETVCLHLEGAEGKSRVQISINLDNKDETLLDKLFEEESVFSCATIKIFNPQKNQEVGTLKVLIENAGQTVNNSTKILVKKTKSRIFVQTDKAVYKPGQTINFRIFYVNEDFKPKKRVIPVVQLQDPGKNRIGQWLNVDLRDGLADLSLPLSSEPPLGKYSIRVKDTVHTFTVEEYVLPRYEVTLQFPKIIMFNSEKFPIKICGKYTYGKPVKGDYEASLCRTSFNYLFWGREPEPPEICVSVSGKLNKLGCHVKEIQAEAFKLNKTGLEYKIKGSASVTEDGTGIELSTSSQASISSVIDKVYFIDADNNYKAGIPYRGLLKVVDAADEPKPGIAVYLSSSYSSIDETLMTDEEGRASFSLNTTDWKGSKEIMARTVLMEPMHYDDRILYPSYGRSYLNLQPFYSRSNSFLKLHSLDRVLPCEGQQEVDLEYIIKGTEMKNSHLDLHYLVTSAGTILDYGSLKITTDKKSEDLHGKAKIQLPLNAGKSSTLRALVYILLQEGDILADSANYKVQRCFKNKVSVKFSPGEVLPGSDVSLRVQATPGSLCGLRVVDQSVVLMNPDKELTVDDVYRLFPIRDSGLYDNRIREDENACQHPWQPRDNDVDVYSLFQGINLKILTSANIKKPVQCHFPDHWHYGPGPGPVADSYRPTPNTVDDQTEKEKPRIYFPETWIWKLVAVEDSGSVDLDLKSPDTITDWTGGAICLASSGFGMTSQASLRVFQPFFVDLTMPYSVVRGETFPLKASVFNYLKQCIKVEVTLGPTEELERVPCADCAYSSCLCADESKTFIWNLKATKLGDVNITVRTEAVDTKDLCQNEIPVVPKQGAVDMIVKPLLVQPGGVLVEKSHSSLLCIKEGEDSTKPEKVSLVVPDNILKDSERAHMTVLGDIMGTALQNLDHLLRMPYGCGEQNMVLLAPNIYILQYLQKSNQMTDAIKSQATNFLEKGYRQQLNYKRDDGSYSAFGKRDPEGNTWLSAFVVKTFSKARPYIVIDESHLNHSIKWLRDHQIWTGKFQSVGKLFNNVMKGGVEDEISLSAYVTIALIEAGVSLKDPMVRNAVSYLKTTAPSVNNIYTQSLMAYAFAVSKETKHRRDLLDKLEEKAVREDGQVHWKRDVLPATKDLYWYQAPSAEVETTSYVLLALLSDPEPDLGKCAEVVKWLSRQQNAFGGYSSTQDTVVALQAMAKYGELTFSDKGDVTVTVSSSSGVLEKFHVDNNNRLLLQKASLPAVNGEYTVAASGIGCAFVQTILRYNIPPPRSGPSFALTVATVPAGLTAFEILIQTKYTGSREKSNMAVIEITMLSGYIPVKRTVRMLETDWKLIKRYEIQADSVTLYLNEVTQEVIDLFFIVEQDIEVEDLKPANVKVYDYYETHEQAMAEYNLPSDNSLFLEDAGNS